MSEIKAVIFDIDGTLSPEVSWIALSRDLGASTDKHRQIFDDFRSGKITYEESRQEGLLPLWRATGRANRHSFEEIFRGWPLRGGAEELVAGLKARGLLVCLISGSFDLYAQTVKNRLQADEAFGVTLLEWNKSGELVTYHYTLDERGQKKLELLRGFCQGRDIKLTECLAVGDSDNDVAIFQATGRGVLLGDTDSLELKEAAWRRVHRLSQISELVL